MTSLNTGFKQDPVFFTNDIFKLSYLLIYLYFNLITTVYSLVLSLKCVSFQTKIIRYLGYTEVFMQVYEIFATAAYLD